MRTVAFCEIDPFCRAVLAKHWPGIPIHEDITRLRGPDVGSIDVICGGFPCQDISLAGKGAGLAGERSGLWREYARLIGDIRPRFVIVENVSALLARGLDRVLGDLAALGYDAEWHCIPASAVGAPHRRDRVWIVSYPNGCRIREQSIGEFRIGRSPVPGDDGSAPDVADTDRGRRTQRKPTTAPMGHGGSFSANGGDVSHANGSRFSLAWSESLGKNGQQGWRVPSTGDWWAVEPDVGRVAHGVPGRVDRLRQLGNSVVPQVVEIIGRAIMKSVNAPLGKD